MEKVAAVLVMALELARSLSDLEEWWWAHQGVIRTLPHDHLGAVIAAKDGAKAKLVAASGRS